jgi:hypothetical protein
VGINCGENGLSKAGKLGVILVLNTSCEKREALQEALDIRVGALELIQRKTSGNFGILARKLPRQPAQVLKLPIVVA